jgi:hypothetical protein
MMEEKMRKKKKTALSFNKVCAVCGKPATKVFKPQRGGYSCQVDGCEEHPEATVAYTNEN